MQACGRCGTLNADAAFSCSSCGAVLVAPGEPGVQTATLEQIPDVPAWVVPGPVKVPTYESKRTGLRVVKFSALLVLWLGVLYAAPLATIWYTSPALRDVGVREYVKPLPTCERSAVDSGDDPSLCSQPQVRERFRAAFADVVTERRRVVAILGLATGAAFLATLLLAMAAGFSAWWSLAAFISPLNLGFAVTAMWSVSRSSRSG